MRTINQEQLARLLKLSRTTVSRCLSNHPAISAETRERVQAFAAEMGYRSAPTRAVRRPRQSTPLTIGVLIGRPLVPEDGLTLPQILEGIRHRAKVDHIGVEVVSLDATGLPPAQTRRQIFRHIRRDGWRGAVLIYPFPADIVGMMARKLSTVSVLTEYPDAGIDLVDTDHTQVQTHVAKLAAAGHRRIGFVTWRYPVGGLWAPRRFAAYAESLFRHGFELNPAWVLNLHAAAPFYETPAVLADQVAELTRRDGVTAWVCAADHQAYALIADLRIRGLEVPRDCSVTGFDGNEPPAGAPPLTTLGVPNADLGASAVARLISRLLDPTSPLRKTLVETAWIPGATLAPPPLAHRP